MIARQLDVRSLRIERDQYRLLAYISTGLLALSVALSFYWSFGWGAR